MRPVNSTLDLGTVLSTIVSRAVQLSGTEAGTIYEFDEQRRELQLRSSHGISDELIQALRDQHLGIGEPTIDRAVACREPVQIEDLASSPSTPARDIVARAGYRALLVVPLLGQAKMTHHWNTRPRQANCAEPLGRDDPQPGALFGAAMKSKAPDLGPSGARTFPFPVSDIARMRPSVSDGCH
jgi:hypothetical protein